MEVQELLGPNGLIYAVNGENDGVNILWGGRRYYSFHRSNSFEKNLGIAILARLGVVQQTIAELFAVERHTVRNILSIYDKEGLAGLQAYKVGRRGVGPELQSFVIQKYLELSDKWGYQNMILEAIKEKVEQGLFSRSISRGELQKLIRLHKQQMTRQREEEQGQREAQEQRQKDRQQREEAAAEPAEASSPQLELAEADRVSVQHGGAAAVIPLLAEFGLKDPVPRVAGGGQALQQRGTCGELQRVECGTAGDSRAGLQASGQL